MKILRRSMRSIHDSTRPEKPERRQVSVVDGDARADDGMAVHPADRAHRLVEHRRDRAAVHGIRRPLATGAEPHGGMQVIVRRIAKVLDAGTRSAAARARDERVAWTGRRERAGRESLRCNVQSYRGSRLSCDLRAVDTARSGACGLREQRHRDVVASRRRRASSRSMNRERRNRGISRTSTSYSTKWPRDV